MGIDSKSAGSVSVFFERTCPLGPKSALVPSRGTYLALCSALDREGTFFVGCRVRSGPHSETPVAPGTGQPGLSP